MTAEQWTVLIDKLDSVLFLLNNLRVIGYFTISCAAALMVLYILWRGIIYFLQKF